MIISLYEFIRDYRYKFAFTMLKDKNFRKTIKFIHSWGEVKNKYRVNFIRLKDIRPAHKLIYNTHNINVETIYPITVFFNDIEQCYMIYDGNHRYDALLRTYGPEHLVDVIERYSGYE